MKEHILSAKDTSTVRKTIRSNNSSMSNSSQCYEEYIVDLTSRTTYVKKKFLGKGGFARCYELLDLTSNKVYAGKIIPKHCITSPIHREKIVREVDLHSSLNHHHVVQFHHFFEDKDNVYILLENCPKKSLVHVLKRRCVLTEPEVRYYMKQLVEGVKYIHNQRVIHRDLKLGNMFLTEDMHMKIGDFGLATKLEKEGDQKITVCGTPNYIAPEVLNKLGHSFQADIWALGCIMYAMLVGKPPFETSSLKDTYNRITNNKYSLPASLSQPAQNLIVELLNACPKRRPSLDAILQHEFFTEFCPTSLSPSTYDTEPEFNESSMMRITSDLSQIKLGPTPKIINKSPLNSGKSHKMRLKESVKETMTPVLNTVLKQAVNNLLQSDNKGKIKEGVNKSSKKSAMYESLCVCLDTMPESPVNPPSVICKDMVYVTKWIDYSNKYGFGFQLSDQNVGVLFNDSSKMNLGTDKSTIHYYDLQNQLIQFSVGEIPSGLAKVTMLLQYFAQYMDENLIEGGDLEVPVDANNNKTDIPFMKRWFRTNKAIVMLLSNDILQVNFFHDHTKIILSPILGTDDIFVTYINEERLSTSYRMSELTVFGCCRIIRQRLRYLQSILKGLPEIDS